jgi:WD40 repeat protein
MNKNIYNINNNNNFFISNLFCDKIILKNEDCIIFLLKLKNGKLITCSQDREINIFNEKTFEIEKTLNGHSNSIISICEINNNKLVSCSDDKYIIIWDLNLYVMEYKFYAHQSYINKVIFINDKNYIVSCSEDKTIKIWKGEFSYSLIETIFGYESPVTNILYLINKELILSTCGKKESKLKFWNINNFYCFKCINNIYCHCNNSLIQLNDNYIAIGGYGIIQIININSYELETILYGHNTLITCLCKINNNYFLSSSEDRDIKQWDNNLYNLISKKNEAHEQLIFSMLQYNNNILISASKDGIIKIWKYNI